MKKITILLIALLSTCRVIPAQWHQYLNDFDNVSRFLKTEKTLWACANDGNFTSSDYGKSWVSDTGLYKLCLTQYKGVIYVGSDKGIYTSYDEGHSWEVFDTTNIHHVTALAVQDSFVYAATYDSLVGKVFFSKNGGSNWIKLLVQNNDNSVKDIKIIDDKALILNSSGILYRGILGVDSFELDYDINCINIQDSVIYTGTGNGVKLSVNRGETWETLDEKLGGKSIIGIEISGNVIFALSSYEGLFVSTDKGKSWELTQSDFDSKSIISLTKMNNRIFIGTNSNGVYYSDDGGRTWVRSSSGISNRFTGKITTNGKEIYTLSSFNLFMTTDCGTSWEEINSFPDMTVFYSVVAFDSLVYLSLCYPDIYKHVYLVSKDHGINWENADKYFNFTGVFEEHGKKYAIDSAGLYTSVDGLNWMRICNNIFNENSGSFYIEDSSIYLASNHYKAYYSSDMGENWETILDSIGGNIISVIKTKNGLFFGDQHGVVYRSTNNGIDWKIYSLGGYYKVLAFNEFGGILFASTSAGIYYYDERKDKFVEFNDGLFYWNYIEYADMCQVSDKVFLSAYGSGISYLSLPDFLMETEVNDYSTPLAGTPPPFLIYPNPAGEFINYNLTENDPDAVIRITNILGDIVKIHKADTMSGIIYLGDLPKGLYLCTIYSKSQMKAVSLILE